LEILLKRSQTSLRQVQDAMSRYFDIRRVTQGRHEWIEGELRQEQGLGKHDPNEDARISITVPYDEKSRKTLLTRFLSPFSGSLYHVTIGNLDLPTTLTVVNELQDLGDVGFGSWAAGVSYRSTTYARISIWKYILYDVSTVAMLVPYELIVFTLIWIDIIPLKWTPVSFVVSFAHHS